MATPQQTAQPNPTIQARTPNFATVAGITLHYQRTGTKGKPALVFVNSLGTDLRIWSEVAAHFEREYDVVRYDKRGHGLSDAPKGPYSIRDHTDDLSALLDHLRLERAVIAGVSVGGMIALDFASAHPDRTSALILCDTGARIGNADMWNARIDEIHRDGLEHVGRAVLARWFSPAFLRQRPAEAAGYLNMLARTTVEGYTSTCAAIRDADLQDAARAVTAPALVVCGDQDLATPPSLAQELAQTLNAPFTLIENAGHLPCIEQPRVLSDTITTFLRSHGEPPEPVGMGVRRAVLGDAHVDRAQARATPFDEDFQQFITRYAWGDVWSRPGLDRATRHLITLGMLAALGKDHELAMHVRATANTSVTREELREVFMQVALYAGLPNANQAFAIAKNVFAEWDGTPQ